MAGDWIKMRNNLWDDPRVSALCDRTASMEASIIGGLYWLWATADQHSDDGLLAGMTVKTLDRKTGISGFGAALVSIGWLEESEAGVTIVRFIEHNGASAKTRAQTAKRVAAMRSGGSGNAGVTAGALHHNDQSSIDGDVTQQALQNRHSTVTGALAREEKNKRSTQKNNPQSSSSTTETQTSTSTEKGTGAGPKCRFPYGETLTDELRAIAEKKLPGYPHDKIFDQWRDYCVAHGKTYSEWTSAWRTWLANVPSFNRGLVAGNTPESVAAKIERSREQLEGALTGALRARFADYDPQKGGASPEQNKSLVGAPTGLFDSGDCPDDQDAGAIDGVSSRVDVDLDWPDDGSF